MRDQLLTSHNNCLMPCVSKWSCGGWGARAGPGVAGGEEVLRGEADGELRVELVPRALHAGESKQPSPVTQVH